MKMPGYFAISAADTPRDEATPHRAMAVPIAWAEPLASPFTVAAMLSAVPKPRTIATNYRRPLKATGY